MISKASSPSEALLVPAIVRNRGFDPFAFTVARWLH
jgi:hypothetical protein